MQAKKIHIIGAGISGLSAGIYAQMNGFDSTIFEMGQNAGGVCTSWERNGYYVNGSIHWLIGSAPGTDIHEMWCQLGVIEDSTFYNHTSFIEFRDIEGNDVHFYTDPQKLKQHFLQISLEDEDVIEEFIHSIQTLARSTFPMDKSFELLNSWEWTKIIFNNLSVITTMGKYNEISVSDFAARFKSKVLRTAFENFWTPELSMTFFMMQMAQASRGNTGYPLGGSGKFVEMLLKRYRELGGKIEFGKKVRKIWVDDHSATGIETQDGEKHLSDFVISACDGNTVLFDMLGDEYIDDQVKEAYHSLQTFPSLVFFSAGINHPFNEVQPSVMGINIPFKEPVKAGNYTHTRGTCQIYNFDPTLAPPGKTLITCILHTDYSFWKNLYDENIEKYQAERQAISRLIISNLQRQFPGIDALVEFTDTATPVTFKNWTGNYQGSYEGWLPTPEASKINLPTHFRSLSNFYMAGHWVKPGGGMPPAAFTGRDAIQLICRQENLHFKTTVK